MKPIKIVGAFPLSYIVIKGSSDGLRELKKPARDGGDNMKTGLVAAATAGSITGANQLGRKTASNILDKSGSTTAQQTQQLQSTMSNISSQIEGVSGGQKGAESRKNIDRKMRETRGKSGFL